MLTGASPLALSPLAQASLCSSPSNQYGSYCLQDVSAFQKSSSAAPFAFTCTFRAGKNWHAGDSVSFYVNNAMLAAGAFITDSTHPLHDGDAITLASKTDIKTYRFKSFNYQPKSPNDAAHVHLGAAGLGGFKYVMTCR